MNGYPCGSAGAGVIVSTFAEGPDFPRRERRSAELHARGPADDADCERINQWTVYGSLSVNGATVASKRSPPSVIIW